MMTEYDHPTQTESQPIAEADLREACDSPLHYLAILHRYLDGGLSGLGAPAQRVFLQFVKESLARGRRVVRITIRQLVDKTGLSKETISAAIRHLSSPEVDLLNIVSRGGAHAPGQYEVRWYTYERGVAAKSPVRRIAKPKSLEGSIENRLQELTSEDREKLKHMYTSLQPKERKEVHEQVTSRLQDLGVIVDKHSFFQMVMFEVLRTRMYHHIKKHYPNSFSYNPVK